MRTTLPDSYRDLSDDELSRRILEAKRRLGGDLLILGHYYQREEVVRFADREGDSFELARSGAASEARHIVFCGVHFMAEASVVLARPGQRVFLPNMDAGCPLSDMARADDVALAWDALSRCGVADRFVPITYMNSSAALKAFCGRMGGLVCTSSSADRAFMWAMGQGKRVFFFPDENLGFNTLGSLSTRTREGGAGEIDLSAVVAWDPGLPGGGLHAGQLAAAPAILWKGHCHVHTLFTTEHVKEMREKNPGCKILVHPECRPEVVAASDGAGSTSYLKRHAEETPEGSTIVIGTEINLVSRLARSMPGKRILPLARSLCPNMFRTSPADLLFTLEEIGKVNEVLVPGDVARDAKVALQRMLSL